MAVQASAGTLRKQRARASAGVRGYGRATPYLFLAPYLLLFLVFVIGPALFGIWMSLHDWDFQLPGKPFVGLQNYKDLFDPLSATAEPFWHGMRATGIFTLASVPFLVAIPLALAVLLNRKFPGRTFFRAVYFAPYVLGVAVIGLMFRYILDTTFGILNAFLGLFGIPEIGWTTEQPWAFVALVAVTVWWTAGFNAIIYLAGLQDIPAEQYEAAELDGANTWQQFRNVTLPGLRPVTVFIVTITLLASANMFGQALLITQGGPGDTTRTALMVITDTGFSQFRMGQAAAMSYLLAIFLSIVALITFALMRERKS
ncbi:binding-protein-dependent transport systems inner membrane component [Kribbella flavida DSM 17836]|uniref:Binding-protein-dependent transport systems inner membrane component n=1 Tax=Kribbella flavida (strain DSM 17836 / JCM 10339 / NBRC 14399) TaxID=479435 RepID=D2PQI9_KRIFD|nr:sugar ABC transporter permease [Kribbella flavida]ADB29176.1 binding-protein-dependent transport systems inner membrane component [Kribbella flavida DSM 17836]